VIRKSLRALLCAALGFGATALVCRQAMADGEPDPKPQRRFGFVLGVAGGLSLGQVAGNPTAQAKRYDPAQRVSTGLGVGYRVTPYLGGALTDWFTFGLGGSYGDLSSGSHRCTVGLFLFRIETYPLFTLGGLYRDLGLSIEFGAGSSNVKNKSDKAEVAASGVASTIGLGVFWEKWRLGPLGLGPSIAYQHNWSDWYARNDLTFGLKANLYGGP
jgi:hypothetical protein